MDTTNNLPGIMNGIKRFAYDHAPDGVRDWMDNRTLTREAEERMELAAASGDTVAAQWLSKEPMTVHATARQQSSTIEDQRQTNLWQRTMEVGRQVRYETQQQESPQEQENQRRQLSL